MRFFLFILLLSFFAPLQCQKSKRFFVTRRDTKEAICIEPSWGSDPYPTFDLDKLQIPRDVGFKYWDWLSEWQLQNDTNVRRRGEKNVLIAGNQPFHFLARDIGSTTFYILASNISLWMADEDQPRGPGMLFELDHLNEITKLKDTTLKYCDESPEVEGAKCTIVDYKNGTNFLNYGNHWTEFVIHLEERKEKPTGVEMNDWSYGKPKPVVQCTWNNTNISNPFTSGKYYAIFAKSHQRNAAFSPMYDTYPDLANNKEMRRNYTKRSSGKFCVEVNWNKDQSYESNESMEVENLVSGRVEPAAITSDGSFQWNHLDAGEYEITVRFDKRKPTKINLCRDDDSEIWRTWISFPKAITKCQFRVGEADFSAGPSSPPDPTLKPDWNLEDWAYVCDQLGIGSNDTEVQIKFCNSKGCNFSKCPHLQHEPSYLFKCLKFEKTRRGD